MSLKSGIADIVETELWDQPHQVHQLVPTALPAA